MGRKTKRTPATVKEILSNIEAGLTYQDAASAAGISESTLYAWVQEFPEFSEALTGARAPDTAVAVAAQRTGRSGRRQGDRGSP
jgi:transposase-like protein